MQGEDGRLYIKGRGLRGPSAADTLVLDFQPQELGGSSLLWFKLLVQVCGALLWWPELTTGRRGEPTEMLADGLR